jgi:teichuronic acid biosynthesis glycosyltransferase TuaG
MPAFNACDTIGRALDSLQAQTYSHWELWVVDDASTDTTAQYVAQAAEQDARINLIRLPHNSGSPAVPRNSALACTNGDYIAFLDADDHWAPEKLARQLRAMQRAGAVMSCTGAKVVGEGGQYVATRTPPASISYTGLLKQNSLICSSVLLDATVLGGRAFPVMGHEDYALWLELTRGGHSVLGIAEPLVYYCIRANSVSANKLKVLPYFWRIYREREGYSWPRAFFFTLRYAYRARQRVFNRACGSW